MKSIFICTALLIMLLGCSPNEKGDVDIKGYLMYQCGSTDPLGGVDVTFGINGTDLITTKTDAFGYFELKGSYNYDSPPMGSPIEKSVAIVGNGQNGGGFGTIILADRIGDNENLDTIYQYNSTQLNLHVIGGISTTQSDTLWLVIPRPFNSGIEDTVKLYGPINDTILFNETIHVVPHVGYPTYYAGGFLYAINPTIKNNFTQYKSFILPFIHGQPNHACGRVYDVTIDLSE